VNTAPLVGDSPAAVAGTAGTNLETTRSSALTSVTCPQARGQAPDQVTGARVGELVNVRTAKHLFCEGANPSGSRRGRSSRQRPLASEITAEPVHHYLGGRRHSRGKRLGRSAQPPQISQNPALRPGPTAVGEAVPAWPGTDRSPGRSDRPVPRRRRPATETGQRPNRSWWLVADGLVYPNPANSSANPDANGASERCCEPHPRRIGDAVHDPAPLHESERSPAWPHHRIMLTSRERSPPHQAQRRRHRHNQDLGIKMVISTSR
jgi:hypothetical protein